MTREILFQIINRQMVVDFVFILIAYFAVDFINYKLIFQIIGFKVGQRQILIGVLLLMFYNICGRLVLPGLVYGLILISILVVTIKVVGKGTVSWFRALWATFLTASISSIGVAALQLPLLLKKDIGSFITKEPVGVALGSLFELVGPLVALYLLRMFNLSLIPFSGKKVSKLNAWSLYLFGTMFFVPYSTIVIFAMSLENGSQLLLLVVVGVTWTMTISQGIAFHVIRTLTQKERDSERLSFEEEKSKLIHEVQETIRSNEETTTAKKLDDTVKEVLHRLQDATLIKTEEFPQGINPKIYLLLNQREITVLKLVGLGKSNKEIAAQTFLSEGSVTNMISGLCTKLELESRIHLAVFAFVHGLVTREELKIKDEIDGKK